MKHPLFSRQAMDTVNEALLKPTEYPGADKTWKSPYGSQGTEDPQSIRQASVAFKTACRRVLADLAVIAAHASDPDLKATAVTSSQDLTHFMATERRADSLRRHRVAEIAIHTEPKVLPPRRDMRSLLDEDVKEEIAESKVGRKVSDGFSSALFARTS